jgi:hypothetical protein
VDVQLIDFLTGIADSEREANETRKLAKKILDQWNAGIVPSMRALHRLKDMREHDKLCARMNEDGSCDWLRLYSHLENLRTPLAGERAFCHRREKGSYEDCHGFKELEALKK